MQKAIVVVGMHRSGTSAVSGLLDELGVFMGKTLYGPQAGVNEKGFFENAKVVELNDDLFDELLQSWDDPLAYNFDNSYADIYQKFEMSTSTLIKNEYGNHALWGMKDPRTSLHLPFWHKLISESQIEPCYLMMVRNPIEVASSLTKRDGFSLQKGVMLWLNYTFSTYQFCNDKKLVTINFDQLISEPDKVLEKICQGFSVDLPTQASNFIEKGLRNNKHDEQGDDELTKLALESYQAFCQPTLDEKTIHSLFIRYQEYLATFDSVFKEHCQAIKKEEVYYRRLFMNAYDSLWWKLSWPLRKVEKSIRSTNKHAN